MVGSEHLVTVTGYSSGGAGVARLEDGRVAFIRSGARGDVLEVTITREQQSSVEAVINRVRTPSPYRIEPDCNVYPACGGCDFRHISYEEELHAKLQRTNDALARIGGLHVRASVILSAGNVDNYRRKATFHSDGKSLGFYRHKSREIVPINRCRLIEEELNDALKNLPADRGVTLHSGQDSRNSTEGATHSWQNSAENRRITLRSGQDSAGNKRVAPHLGQNDNENRRAAIHSVQSGMKGAVTEELDGLTFIVEGFFQVNKAAALLLFQKAREFASMTKNETLLDLYCGVGALTLFVGRDAGTALGVEHNPAAVDAARENAKLNSLPHVAFICADAAEWDAEDIRPDCIIVDPPRKGLSRSAVQKIAGLSPARIVYISCDPATLARDLRLLDGYSTDEVCVVDMFPRTANVECCCLLRKK